MGLRDSRHATRCSYADGMTHWAHLGDPPHGRCSCTTPGAGGSAGPIRVHGLPDAMVTAEKLVFANVLRRPLDQWVPIRSRGQPLRAMPTTRLEEGPVHRGAKKSSSGPIGRRARVVAAHAHAVPRGDPQERSSPWLPRLHQGSTSLTWAGGEVLLTFRIRAPPRGSRTECGLGIRLDWWPRSPDRRSSARRAWQHVDPA